MLAADAPKHAHPIAAPGVYMTGSAMVPDEQLIQRMATRDEEALAELHRRYAPYLATMARRMLRDPDEIQQGVQDAFVKVWDNAERFDASKASAKTWLVTVAHRLFINRLRGKKLSTVALESWDGASDPPDHVERIYLREAVDSLEETERTLIDLAFYRGHSHQELSDLTEMPLGTVKTHLRRALGKLREQLGGGDA